MKIATILGIAIAFGGVVLIGKAAAEKVKAALDDLDGLTRIFK